MTVRTVELLTAIALALASIAIMVKSTDGLAIGWIPGSGPGAGAWPFWLSAGMLITSLATIYRWFAKATPQSRSDEPFMSREAIKVVGITILALVTLLVLTPIISIYFALIAFLFFYFRILGGHGWFLSIILSLAVPSVDFLFFEWALVIPLPKGFAEPVFYPIYELIY